MRSVQFENDVFLFETFFKWKQGESGDGYLQPDDNDYLNIDSTYMIGYITEDGEKLILETPADVTYIINKDVIDARDEAIDKEINCHLV